MNDIEFFNEKLSGYLQHDNYKKYKQLIQLVINSDDLGAKSNLLVFMMNHMSSKYTIDSLINRLQNIYSSDYLSSYLNKIIFYNPKLGCVSIGSSSNMDSKDHSNLYLDIPCSEEHAINLIKKITELLTIIITESKFSI